MCLLGFASEAIAASVFVVLHLPNNEEAMLNVDTIVSMRHAEHAADEGRIQEDIRCVIYTSDGRFISVTESCDEVREMTGIKK